MSRTYLASCALTAHPYPLTVDSFCCPCLFPRSFPCHLSFSSTTEALLWLDGLLSWVGSSLSPRRCSSATATPCALQLPAASTTTSACCLCMRGPRRRCP